MSESVTSGTSWSNSSDELTSAVVTWSIVYHCKRPSQQQPKSDNDNKKLLPEVFWKQATLPPLVASPTHCGHTKIVQLYLPGGANVYSPNKYKVLGSTLSSQTTQHLKHFTAFTQHFPCTLLWAATQASKNCSAPQGDLDPI